MIRRSCRRSKATRRKHKQFCKKHLPWVKSVRADGAITVEPPPENVAKVDMLVNALVEATTVQPGLITFKTGEQARVLWNTLTLDTASCALQIKVEAAGDFKPSDLEMAAIADDVLATIDRSAMSWSNATFLKIQGNGADCEGELKTKLPRLYDRLVLRDVSTFRRNPAWH